MGFGISFGSKTQSQTSQTAMNKDELANSSGSSTQNQTQTGSTTGLTNTAGQTAATGATKNTGTTSQNTVGTQQQQQVTTSFSDAILKALQDSATKALTAGGTAVGPSADRLNTFDPSKFVGEGMTAARSATQGKLEEDINHLVDSTGGTAGGNSMTALLANRLRGDSEANLAGIHAQLVGAGEQQQRENVLAGITATGQQQGFAAQLLNALKGGVTTGTGTVATSEAQTGAQQQVGESQQAQQSAQTEKTQQDTTQILSNIINQLLSSNTHTTGAESSAGTAKSGGFGLSLSL